MLDTTSTGLPDPGTLLVVKRDSAVFQHISDLHLLRPSLRRGDFLVFLGHSTVESMFFCYFMFLDGTVVTKHIEQHPGRSPLFHNYFARYVR